ncbi:MAG TPA: hypothetical protein VMT29_02795 [Steroidobacteraceae bacterium]|nr:hypothetical protein [Steroidobacteraceae bacterium]
MRFMRLLIPGLVIQAVLVGGGYSTGRELVEFFLKDGPATALPGMAFTALIFSLGAMVSFELARRYQAFDYRSFCRVYMGPAWVLFEWGYLAILLLVLSVVASAGGKLLSEITGTSELVDSALFTAAVGVIVFFGSTFIERVISVWSVVFYIVYGSLFFMIVRHFGSALASNLAAAPLSISDGLRDAISYAGYNIAMLPVLTFVARNLRTRREAFISGALAGPLILLPGFAFLLALSAFYPAVVTAPLPVTLVLAKVGSPLLTIMARIVILGALLKTGVGLLHGLNERFARHFSEKGVAMPRGARPAISIGLMVLSVYLAAALGIVELIARGYRYSSYYFLAVFVLPLATRGVWMIFRPATPPVVAATATARSD